MKLWIALALLVTSSFADDEYVTYDFVLEVVEELGESATFECLSDYRTQNSTDLFWILPNYDNVYTNWTDFPDDIDLEVSFNDTEIGMVSSLTIYDVQQPKLGSYYCVYRIDNFVNDDIYMQRFGLNLKGPYFEDTWEKYSTNVAIAFASMFSFLAATAYVYVVYRYRWIPEEEDEKKEAGPSSIEVVGDYEMSTQSNGNVNKSNGSFDNHAMQEEVESERL